MIDMHLHILPGVDDGARDAEMTRAMARRAADAGVTFMVATPHVYHAQDQLRNRQALRLARSIAHEEGLKLAMGCEFNYRAFYEAGEDLAPFCLAGTRCVLLEFSTRQILPNWQIFVSDLCERGYFPIIAHPERYAYVQRDMGIALEMRDLGCELQLDAGGLLAPPLSAERRTARRLLREGLASYVASDAHRPQDYDTFAKAARVFAGEWPRRNRLTAQLRAKQKEREA